MNRLQLSYPLVYYLSCAFVHAPNGPEGFTRRTPQEFIPLMGPLLHNLVSRSSLDRFRFSFVIFFFYFHLLEGVCFEVLVIFLLSERSDSLLIWEFYSFRYLSISTSHYDHDTLSRRHFIALSWLLFLLFALECLFLSLFSETALCHPCMLGDKPFHEID